MSVQKQSRFHLRFSSDEIFNIKVGKVFFLRRIKNEFYCEFYENLFLDVLFTWKILISIQNFFILDIVSLKTMISLKLSGNQKKKLFFIDVRHVLCYFCLGLI